VLNVRQWKAKRKGIKRTIYEEIYWEQKAFGNRLDGMDEPTAQALILIESIVNLWQDHMSNKNRRSGK
jgi:hypothetical protein